MSLTYNRTSKRTRNTPQSNLTLRHNGFNSFAKRVEKK